MIPEGHKKNFDTLKRAMKSDRVALMECTDAITNKPVYVLAMVNMNHDNSTEFVLIAKFFDGNPYEELMPPESKEIH